MSRSTTRSVRLATRRPRCAACCTKSTASDPALSWDRTMTTTSTESDENDGDRAAQLAARVGVPAFPWQWIALRKILSRRPDGLWTHPDCLTLTTRQSGKSQVLLLRILFGLFVLNERIVFSAQRWVTSEAIYKRLKAIIESRPSLQRRLAKDPSSSSSRAVIELKSGASVAIGVRSGDLGRGMDAVDLVVFDEAYSLTEAEVAALTGAQLSSPNAQTIYASTPAVWEKHADCKVLSDLRRLGQQRPVDCITRSGQRQRMHRGKILKRGAWQVPRSV